MSILDFLDDYIMGPLNIIDHLEGVLSGIRHRDLGRQFAIPRIDKGGPLSLNEVEEMLNRYGIVIYGRTHDAQHMYFHVKKRQAAWAEYLLLHAGAELVGPLVDPRNAGYVNRHAPGWMPTPWLEAKTSPTMRNQESTSQSLAEKTEIGSMIDWWNRL
ncbi:hypothetical protein GC175_25355 [bacterium]|nr:hypothetical protein [bacterium]